MQTDKAKNLNYVVFTRGKNKLSAQKLDDEWRRSDVVELRARGLSIVRL